MQSGVTNETELKSQFPSVDWPNQKVAREPKKTAPERKWGPIAMTVTTTQARLHRQSPH